VRERVSESANVTRVPVRPAAFASQTGVGGQVATRQSSGQVFVDANAGQQTLGTLRRVVIRADLLLVLGANTEVSQNTGRNFDVAILFLLALSLAANLWQLVLRKEAIKATGQYTASSTAHKMLPTAGMRLNGLHLLDEHDTSVQLEQNPKDLPLIVYVLSPTCKWCKANIPSVDALVTQTQGRYRFVGVSGTSIGLTEYIHQTAPPFSHLPL
jgi:hypothetical protein